jgi:Domain of unknown function (DUF4332)
MMEKDRFHSYLKARGKTEHVILGLIKGVEDFSTYLQSQHGKALVDASEEDILAYSRDCDAKKANSAREAMRSLALYYRCTGNETCSQAAANLREEAIAAKRKSIPLREFRGVLPAQIAALETAGIRTAERMLAEASTLKARQDLSTRTGVPEKTILELVKLSDLSRLEGVKAIRARLYHDAGLDSVEKLASIEPAKLLEIVREFVRRTGFDGIPTLPKEAEATVEAARKLPIVLCE